MTDGQNNSFVVSIREHRVAGKISISKQLKHFLGPIGFVSGRRGRGEGGGVGAAAALGAAPTRRGQWGIGATLEVELSGVRRRGPRTRGHASIISKNNLL